MPAVAKATRRHSSTTLQRAVECGLIPIKSISPAQDGLVWRPASFRDFFGGMEFGAVAVAVVVHHNHGRNELNRIINRVLVVKAAVIAIDASLLFLCFFFE